MVIVYCCQGLVTVDGWLQQSEVNSNALYEVTTVAIYAEFFISFKLVHCFASISRWFLVTLQAGAVGTNITDSASVGFG